MRGLAEMACRTTLAVCMGVHNRLGKHANKNGSHEKRKYPDQSVRRLLLGPHHGWYTLLQFRIGRYSQFP